GLPSFADLKAIYHYEQIDADTKVYGVLGDPVAHSLSPLVHNLCLRQLGLNAVYLPFRVPRTDNLAGFLKAFERVPVQGYSVTIPQKEPAATAARPPDEPASTTHAANTLLRGGDGFSAYNTDYQAVLDSLKTNLQSFAAGPPNVAATGIRATLP